MKGNSMEYQVRRHVNEKAEWRRTERRDERTHHNSRGTDRSDYHRAEEKTERYKSSRRLEEKTRKEHRMDTKDYRSVKDDKRYSEKNNNFHSNRSRHISPFLARREGVHRNSPVELTVKGCRNTDSSSSSSSSSDSESDHPNHRSSDHRRHRRKHSEEKEESYEELSRKKRRIESELNALMAEEAENSRKHNEKKKSTRNQERMGDVRLNRPIKQERISDDERSSSNARKSDPPKRSGEKNEWGKKITSEQKKPVKDREKPNFGLSGKLTEDTNTYNGVVIKYSEPKEARKPKRRWRLYPFKGETSLNFIPIHRQSAYLLGRNRLVADIPIDHPSCSKQHAALQYRLVDYEREDGTVGRRVRPYIIDLDSSNGTYVNNNRIEPRRYVELMEKDIIKFGYSSREYVILHDQSKDDPLDDDVVEEGT